MINPRAIGFSELTNYNDSAKVRFPEKRIDGIRSEMFTRSFRLINSSQEFYCFNF